MELDKLNESMKLVLNEYFSEPLCTNDDYSARETFYLEQIDIEELKDKFDEEEFAEFPTKLKKADGKYIVSDANYPYTDIISDGDYDTVIEILGKTPTEAMANYWKQAIENDGEDVCKEWFLMFEFGPNAYWEEGEYAKEFRRIGEELLNITSGDYEE